MIGSGHHLQRILDDAQCIEVARRLRQLFTPAVERLGWTPRKGESELESQLRGDLIGALGTLAEDKDCQQRARELFAQYENAPDSVDRNLIPALVAIVAHTGTAPDYEKFYNKFKTAKTPQDETRYLFALANFRVAELIDRTLQLTISGEVRTQNSPYLMRGILFEQTRARESVGVHESALGRDAASVSRQCDSTHVRRHHRPGEAGVGGRCARIFRQASGQAGRQADGAALGAAPRGGLVSGAMEGFAARLVSAGIACDSSASNLRAMTNFVDDGSVRQNLRCTRNVTS